jgi:hypothetical protein
VRLDALHEAASALVDAAQNVRAAPTRRRSHAHAADAATAARQRTAD